MRNKLASFAALLSAPVFAATTLPVQLISPTGSTSGQAILSTGSSSAPAWGSFSVSSLAAQAANTVVANATSGSASPTAFAMPSCSTSGSALTWTSNTGFTCNTSVNATQLNGATFSAPGAIGGGTPAAGSFTTLSASSTVSGAGFSTYLASPPAIGGTVAAAGSFTAIVGTSATITNALATGVSAVISSTSNTATGAAIQLTGNGVTTPSKYIQVKGGVLNILNNAATAVVAVSDAGGLTLSSTLAPSYPSGVAGNVTGSNVTAGAVGEVISSNVAVGSAVAITSGVAKTITSITLTAGDWDVWGAACDKPASGTVQQLMQVSISETDNTDATAPNGGAFALLPFTAIASQAACTPVGMKRVNVSGTQTEYLVITSVFTVSTNAAYGFIGARRR